MWKVGQRSRSQVENNGLAWKVLSQGIHMWNMRALALFLLVQKFLPRLKLFESIFSFKVKVTMPWIVVPIERSCHKECTSELEKVYLNRFKCYGQVLLRARRHWGMTIALRTFVLASKWPMILLFISKHIATSYILVHCIIQYLWNAKLTYIQIFVPISKYLYLGTNNCT